MFKREQLIDENFKKTVHKEEFSHLLLKEKVERVSVPSHDILSIVESQFISRHLDFLARRLKDQGRGFYTIGSFGHEGNAAMGWFFPLHDMCFLHYRSNAFVVERSKKHDQSQVIKDIILSLMASKKDPIACGRHKVFGSHLLNIPPQTSTIASHLPKAVGTALALPKAVDLSIENSLKKDSIVLCSFGDASFNHSCAQTAMNSAAWVAYNRIPLPLVFICEDNGIGISTATPKGWITSSMQSRPHIEYIEVDGLNPLSIISGCKKADQIARKKRRPVFLHFRCIRMLGHAGSDIETEYRTVHEIEKIEAQDPLIHSAKILLDNQLLSKHEILSLYEKKREEVEGWALQLMDSPVLSSVGEICQNLVSTKVKNTKTEIPSEKKRDEIFAGHKKKLKTPLNLCRQINFALTDLMIQYDNMVLFGQDVAHKGGVYHVTTNLLKRFGNRRVFDTILDETSMLGLAIGHAHTGFLPIVEIQYLAYFHNAEDQIRGEAASLSFFSDGQFINPMVIRIPSFAYQKGFGGHFHNDNSIAVLRDIPGIIIAAPSSGNDAAKMLRTCVKLAKEEGRVIAFLEPIALYMTKDLYENDDQKWLSPYPHPSESIGLGEIHIVKEEKARTVIVSYGNGFYLSLKAQNQLRDKFNTAVTVIDIRWLKPLPILEIVEEIKNYDKVLIVDECRKTGSLSEELFTQINEVQRNLHINRITAEDCFIPLGDASRLILPSVDKIVNHVIDES